MTCCVPLLPWLRSRDPRADAAYVPPNPDLWSFLNCRVHGGFCEASMWMASVVGDGPGFCGRGVMEELGDASRPAGAGVPRGGLHAHAADSRDDLGTGCAARSSGSQRRVVRGGGYLFPYDSQETACWSAIEIVLGLGASSRAALLLADSSVDSSQIAGLLEEADA